MMAMFKSGNIMREGVFLHNVGWIQKNWHFLSILQYYQGIVDIKVAEILDE